MAGMYLICVFCATDEFRNTEHNFLNLIENDGTKPLLHVIQSRLRIVHGHSVTSYRMYVEINCFTLHTASLGLLAQRIFFRKSKKSCVFGIAPVWQLPNCIPCVAPLLLDIQFDPLRKPTKRLILHATVPTTTFHHTHNPRKCYLLITSYWRWDRSHLGRNNRLDPKENRTESEEELKKFE